MSVVRGVLNVSGKCVMFWCPGCDEPHVINTEVWGFDGNYDEPTFSPSVLVHPSRRFIDDTLFGPALTAPENIGMSPRCHSFVERGQIRFLADSEHALSGQTVPLPEWPWRFGSRAQR